MLKSPEELTGLLIKMEAGSRQDPNDIQLMLRLARLYIKNKDNISAEKIYERILKISPDNAQIMIELADVQIKRSAFSEALFNLERVLEIKPGLHTAFIAMARLNEAQNRPDKQVYFLRLAADSAPERVEIRIALAELLRKYADFSGAIKQYEKVLVATPDSEIAMFALASIYMRQNNQNIAITFLRKIVKQNPGAIDAHFNLGNCLFRQCKYNLAIPHFKIAQRKEELLQKALYLTAQCYSKICNYDHAIVTLENLLETDENNISFLKSLGEIYETIEEFDMAGDIYKKLSLIAPERPEFMINQAKSFLRTGNHSRVKKILESLFKKHPGHIEGHLLLGSLYSHNGSYKSAIEEFRHILLVNEHSIKAWKGLANVYYAIGDIKEEYRSLENSIKCGCEEPEILLKLGQIEQSMKLPISLSRFKKVAELAPGSDLAREAEYFIRHQAA